MRHQNRRGKLGRKTAHRLMMLRNMTTSLFDKERIMTTMPRAKQLRPFAEKLITLARRQDLHARRQVARVIQKKEVLRKLFGELAERFKAAEKGGYLRIVPYRSRWGDGSEMAFVEFKDYAPVKPEKADKKGAKKGKTAEAKADKSAGKKAAGKKEAGKKEAKQAEASK